MRRPFLIASALTLSAAAGCTTDDTMRIEGLTPDAGDAQAVNTVLQMVDPWQPGVQDTRLDVPAVRTTAAPGATGGGSAAKPLATTDN